MLVFVKKETPYLENVSVLLFKFLFCCCIALMTRLFPSIYVQKDEERSPKVQIN